MIVEKILGTDNYQLIRFNQEYAVLGHRADYPTVVYNGDHFTVLIKSQTCSSQDLKGLRKTLEEVEEFIAIASRIIKLKH